MIKEILENKINEGVKKNGDNIKGKYILIEDVNCPRRMMR